MNGSITKDWNKLAAAWAGLAESDVQILKAVKSIAYGSVEVVVHDSRVVQIEKRVKVRLDN